MVVKRDATISLQKSQTVLINLKKDKIFSKYLEKLN